MALRLVTRGFCTNMADAAEEAPEVLDDAAEISGEAADVPGDVPVEGDEDLDAEKADVEMAEPPNGSEENQ